MIRKLGEADRERCFDLVKQKLAENLFIIGDIEAFGFDEDFQEVWGDFDAAGQLRAVLLRYRRNYIPYAPGNFDVRGFAQIIEADPNAASYSGLQEITQKLQNLFNKETGEPRLLYYAKCEDAGRLNTEEDLSMVKLAAEKDVDRMVELQGSVFNYQDLDGHWNSMKKNITNGFTRAYYIEENGKIVSVAQTTAENSASAMVVGVATDPNVRKKGYATKCLTKLGQTILNEGKSLCLFYDNPDAGKIYKRLGYVDIGLWTMTNIHQGE